MKIDIYDRISIIRLLVAIIAITVIFIVGLMVIEPFIPALVLSLILTLATWPGFIWLEKKLDGRTTLAASMMTLILGVFFLIPLIFLGATLVDSFKGFVTAAMETVRSQPATPPDWTRHLPVVGQYADSIWGEYVQDKQKIPMLLQEHSGDITKWLFAVTGSIGRGVLDVLLSIIISFFMFRHGVATMQRLRDLIANFGGSKAVHLLSVSKGTLIAVIYGVVGTAVVQGVAAVIGFMITGIPGAPFLGLLTFIMSLIPGGPPFIWIPACLWLVMENSTGAAIFLGIWGLIAISGVDNIVRPYFISLGTNLPILLILMGVIGGILAFGFIGLFVGPTILAVAYNIVLEWSHNPNGQKEEPVTRELPEA